MVWCKCKSVVGERRVEGRSKRVDFSQPCLKDVGWSKSDEEVTVTRLRVTGKCRWWKVLCSDVSLSKSAQQYLLNGKTRYCALGDMPIIDTLIPFNHGLQ